MTSHNVESDLESLLPLILGTGFNDPYPIYNELRLHHPVYRDSSGIWLVSQHRLITGILDDPCFSPLPPSPPRAVKDQLGYLSMVVFQHGEQHNRLRRLLAPLFSKKRLEQLQAFIDAEILRLLEPLQYSAQFDLVSRVANVLPIRTICHLLGFPDSTGHGYLKASSGAWRLISAMKLGPYEHAQAAHETQRFLDQLASFVDQVDSKKTPDHPILYFRHLEKSGELDRRAMLANLLFIFIAGYGTTLFSIGNTVSAIMKNPTAWQTLRSDIKLIPQAVRELQRFDPPVQTIFRYPSQNVKVDDRVIRRGEQIALLLGAANRDPDEFTLPDNIDLHRTRGRALTFGAGPHSCMGLVVARMQLESLLRALCRHMPDIILSETDSYRVQRGAFHGFSQLWLDNRANRWHSLNVKRS